MEVQNAFNTTEGLRDERQHDIVRIIVQNGKATATAWEKKHTGQVIYSPRHRSCVCAAHTDCRVPQQALTAREARTVDAGTASGKATAGAWDKERTGQVTVCHRRRSCVCAARTDCRVPQQALTAREARTVDAGKASGKANAGAWDAIKNGQVRAKYNAGWDMMTGRVSISTCDMICANLTNIL